MSHNTRPEQPEAGEIYSEHLLTAKLSGDSGHDMLQALATDDSARVEVAMEKAYLRELNETRADILHKLIGHDALSLGNGWAIFEVSTQREYDVVNPKNYNKSILLISAMPNQPIIRGDEIRSPHIRILTKQLTQTWYGDQWFTEDVTLGENNDSQYRVDTMHKFKKRRHLDAAAPLFGAGKDNKLRIENVKTWAPDDMIDILPTSPEEHTEPIIFSERDDINDKIDALARARQILADIYDLEPRFHNPGIR